MIKETNCGAIIFRRDHDPKYLMLYRKASSLYKQNWEFSKGLREPNEADIDTVKREVKEETGLKDMRFVEGFKERVSWFFKRNGETVNKESIYYLIETEQEEIILSEEHEEYKWMTFDEAMQVIKFKNLIELFKKADNVVKHDIL